METVKESVRAYRVPRYHVQLVREGSLATSYPRFSNSVTIADWLRPMAMGTDREHFWLITLDAKNRLIGFHEISTGSLSTSVVHPREVAKAAILQSAAAVICVHNHPSGDPGPSREDREVTERLYKVMHTLGIRMLDHIIIGEDDHFSFADNGHLSVINVQ